MAGDPVSVGIAVNEEMDTPDLSDPLVTHAYVVTGDDEAESAESSGIMRVRISDYLAEGRTIYFGQPARLDDAMAAAIVNQAKSRDGDGYAYWGIVARLLADNPLGKAVNLASGDWVDKEVSALLEKQRREFCSEMAAECLQNAMPAPLPGCLQMPARMIAPLRLLKDRAVLPVRTGPFRKM